MLAIRRLLGRIAASRLPGGYGWNWIKCLSPNLKEVPAVGCPAESPRHCRAFDSLIQ